MTTPSINSAYSVITDAYEDATLLQQGDTLNGEQLAKGMKRLRDVLNFFQIKGLKVFLWDDVTVTLVAGQAEYTLGSGGDVDMTKPLSIMQAYYLYTATNVRRPITVMSANDYFLLGQAGTLTANRGTVSQYYAEKLYNEINVTFWLCPDATEVANGAAHLFLRKQWTNATNLTDTLEFEPAWRIAIRWALAYELASSQPQSVIERCQLNRDTYMEALEGWDAEDAPTSIQADSRTGVPGNFR